MPLVRAHGVVLVCHLRYKSLPITPATKLDAVKPLERE